MVMLVESVWKGTIGIKYFSYNGFFYSDIFLLSCDNVEKLDVFFFGIITEDS